MKQMDFVHVKIRLQNKLNDEKNNHEKNIKT